jgi:SH3 domain-containing YSC84-like protein 1
MKLQKQNIVSIAIALAAVIATAGAPHARSGESAKDRVAEAAAQSAKAAKAFDEIMQIPDKAIPQELLRRAKAIAVFPQVIKVAFNVGGEGGRGVVSRRLAEGWGDPVFLRGGGGSVGPQIGASSTDFVLLLMNDESVEGLMKDKFELGGEASIAAGPVGRNAGAGTDALMQAAILSYSRSRGLFAGLNLKGIVIKPEDDLNLAVYNKTARELLSDQTSAAPEPNLRAFPQTLGRYAANSTDQR